MEIDGPRHSVSVSAVIADDQGRVLSISRRDNGQWEPPGGVLELDESITDGLIREVHEETGLTVQPQRLTGVYKNMVRGIVALVFRCHVVGGTLAASCEAAEVAWLTPADVQTRMAQAYSSRVTDALSNMTPVIRTHDGNKLID